MAYLGTTPITGVTGTFERGCLGYWNGEYLLLDRTPATPRLIRISTTTVQGNPVPNLTVGNTIELSPSEDYYGIGTSGGAVVVLQKHIRWCGDTASFAIAQLSTVDIRSGSVLESQEILTEKRVEITGGLCRKGPNWLILGKSQKSTNFYEIHNDHTATPQAIFQPQITNRSALTYDRDDKRVFVLNGSNEGLAFNHEYLNRDTIYDITLDSANANPVGIVWTPTAIAVLNANPLGIYWYGEVGQSFTDVSAVSQSSRRQLKRLSKKMGLDFSIGGVTFRGIKGKSIRRFFIPEASPSIIERPEIRITPQYVLNGVRTGMTIIQGSDSYKIKEIYSFNNDYAQSFLC